MWVALCDGGVETYIRSSPIPITCLGSGHHRSACLSVADILNKVVLWLSSTRTTGV